MGNVPKDPKEFSELSERKKLILKSIVEAHIAEGEPVGSKYLIENNRQLTCSSATIRNEMAELEAMGYLEQPHTSAGRVPSERGYRLYIDSLIERYAMTASEITEINRLLRSKVSELDQILALASKLASSLTDYAGIAVKPKRRMVQIEKFELIFMDPTTSVLVAVPAEGSIKTKNVRFPENTDTVAAAHLASLLNQELSGLSAEEITLPVIMKLENEMGGFSSMVNPVIKTVYEILKEMDDGDLKVSGIDRLLNYPEYSNTEQLKKVLGAIEDQDEIVNLVSKEEEADTNIPSGESSVKVMDNSAIVYRQIMKDGHTVGAIGVIGPLRMDYAKVLATLDELSGNIETMISGDDKKLLSGGGEQNG